MAARKIKKKAAKKSVKHPVPQRVAIVAMGRSKQTYLMNAAVAGGARAIHDEVWAINVMGGVIQHDLLFHMDDCRIQEARAKENPAHQVAKMVEWLKDHPAFITSRAYPDYPGAVEFPLEEVLQKFKCTYLNNTVVYAFVYAMYIGVPHVTIYGADYSYPEQPHKAEEGRACLEFWIGCAVTRGMQVEVAEGSTLLDASKPDSERFYGYDTVDVKVDRDEKGNLSVTKTEREPGEIPTAAQMEERYNHQPKH